MSTVIGLEDVVRIDDVVTLMSEEASLKNGEVRLKRGLKPIRTGLRLTAGICSIIASMTLTIPLTAEATAPPHLKQFKRATDITDLSIFAPGDVYSEFKTLAEQWRSETMFTSSLLEQIEHPAYQRIIALGRPAVPYLLAEMKSKPDHWGYALTQITGVDPIPSEAHGRLPAIAKAWVKWGEQNGFPI